MEGPGRGSLVWTLPLVKTQCQRLFICGGHQCSQLSVRWVQSAASNEQTKAGTKKEPEVTGGQGWDKTWVCPSPSFIKDLRGLHQADQPHMPRSTKPKSPVLGSVQGRAWPAWLPQLLVTVSSLKKELRCLSSHLVFSYWTQNISLRQPGQTQL